MSLSIHISQHFMCKNAKLIRQDKDFVKSKLQLKFQVFLHKVDLLLNFQLTIK